jgi:hypothetical protein
MIQTPDIELEEFETICEDVLAETIRDQKRRNGMSREECYKWLAGVGANHVRNGSKTPKEGIEKLNRLMWVYDEAATEVVK